MNSYHFRYLTSCFALATSYILSAFLCAQVSIAGQYPDPIWLPAGIAFGGLFIGGIRRWPGVLIGATFYNTYHLIHQTFSPSAAAIGIAIAMGSTLQAMAGAWACRKFPADTAVRLDSVKSIWRFLVLGGPVACVISPTLGILVLLEEGRISASGAMHDWFYWWSGDSIGVLLGAPFLLVLASGNNAVWKARRLTVGLPLAVAMLVIFFILGLTFRFDAGRIRSEFDRHATLLASALEYKFKEVEDSVSSIADLFRSAGNLRRDQFESFAHGIYVRNPSIRALGWAPMVRGSDLKSYEAAMRETGQSSYRIEQRESSGRRVASTDRPEYFPVQFVYPFLGNEAAIGFDLGSEPTGQRAIALARQRHHLAVTENVRLITDSSGDSGVLIFDPVFPFLSDTRSDLSGVALAAVGISQLVKLTFSGLPHDNIAFQLDDTSAPAEQRRLYATGEPVKEPIYRSEHMISVGNRLWQITFWPSDDYVRLNASWSIPLMQLGTLTFSLLLSAFLLILTGRSIRIEEQVFDRTRELEMSRNQAQRAWKLLEEAVGSVSHGFIIYDQADRFVMANEAYRKYYEGSGRLLVEGSSFEQILRDQTQLGMYDLEGQDAAQWLADKIRSHQLADGQATERRLSDGRWLMTVEQRTPSGYIVGNRIDITELKQATAQLQDRNVQLDTLFRLSPDGLAVVSAEKIVVFVNPSFLAVTGLASHEILGRSYSVLDAELRSRAENQERFPGLDQLFGRPGDAPHSSLLKLRFPKPTTLKLVGVWSKSEQAPYLLYSRDVTLETELDEMKSEFLAHAAHELRTPLTSIYGFSELLLKRDFDAPTRRELLETIHRQTAWLADIINELLDLSRIDARRGKDFKPEPFDLRRLVTDVASGFVADCERWPILIEGVAEPVLITADISKSRQAITNVLSNARKYSPKGGEIRVRMVSDGVFYGVAIADRGVGMSPTEIERVTERFWRSDLSGVTPGTGLGMAIVKEIIEIHGGRLEIQSAPNAGTTVTLLWPQQALVAMRKLSG